MQAARRCYGSRLCRWAALAACLLAGAASAGPGPATEDCTDTSPDCVAVGHWNFSVALGAGVRTNPLVNGKDIPLVIVPHVSYYGERFFLDDLDLGFTLAEGRTQSLSLVASPGYDRVYFYRTDPQNFFITGIDPTGAALYSTDSSNAISKVTPRPRRLTYLAGPEWTFKASVLTGQLDVLHDITGQDHGTEVRAALSAPLIESRGALSASLGLTWKSAGIVDYYYGEPGLYAGKAALDPFAKLGYTVPLSRRWRFNAFAEYERLGSAIADSPIVAEHTVATVFVGAVYTF
jgi:outer membrane protein